MWFFFLKRMLTGKPLFPGKNAEHQLDFMTDLLGTPSTESIARNSSCRAPRKQYLDQRYRATLIEGMRVQHINLVKFDIFNTSTTQVLCYGGLRLKAQDKKEGKCDAASEHMKAMVVISSHGFAKKSCR
ncbi:hypothetical protein RIF29_39200 [Crotalaria pallida]|uniref:Protein kinase domain-containing protein n=1 Tax=Crotalaria pallida TaxID=3830 RepID=A0AAN9HPF0_CROPI